MSSTLSATLKLLLSIFIVSVFVHFLWEMAQSFAYAMGSVSVTQAVWFHLRATLGDALLMWIQYGAVAAWRRDLNWIAQPRWMDLIPLSAVGFVISTTIEMRALAAERWSYSEAMPLVPGLEVGLLPVLQLLLLPWPIYWAAWRLARPLRAGGASSHP